MILNNRFYQPKMTRVNYTSYDVRQGQDSLNARNHAYIVTLPRTDLESADHPFEYAPDIGIFHVDVLLNIPGYLQHLNHTMLCGFAATL